MLRVGLTGGVGSGKSSVADMFEQLGARVSRSDEIGRALMQPGEPAFDAIAGHFGLGVVTAAGTLDRARLARLAFEEGRVEELNALVHPAVIEAQQQWMEQVAREDPDAVAVVESALIFETRHGRQDDGPWRTRFDRVAVVTAPEALRRQRYIVRTAVSQSPDSADAAARDFENRARAQWSDDRKAALADVVLRNEGTFDDLRAKAAEVFAAWKQESIDRVRGAP